MATPRMILSRRFGPMFVCIALGAFNDNFYKNALIILTTYVLAAKAGHEPAVLISIASACFIIPYFLFSGVAGELADRMPKHKLVRILKATELALMVFAALALYFGHLPALMAILFLLGLQAAFLGPTKYAILPELLAKDELLMGNGITEGGTFICILLGTLVSGLLVLEPHGTTLVSLCLIAAAIVGVLAARAIPATHVMKPDMPVHFNVIRSTWRMVLHACHDRLLLLPILGISWFWAIGATYLTQIPVFTKEILAANERVVTLFNGLFTVGIGLGALCAPLILKRLAVKRLAPLALFGVFVFGLDLCFVSTHTPKPNRDELVGVIAYLSASRDHIRIALDLFLMAFSGGAFIVPLYTQLQVKSPEHERARTIAANNVINSLFIAAAALSAAGMFALHLSVIHVLFVFAILNLPIVLLMIRADLPESKH